MAKSRGKRPTPAPADVDVSPDDDVDPSRSRPIFSLQYLIPDFSVKAPKMTPVLKAAFAERLQELSALDWGTIQRSPRHGMGYEMLLKSNLKPALPAKFQDTEKVMVFRYSGLLPMAGVRVTNIFYVLAIEAVFNDLYDHGD